MNSRIPRSYKLGALIVALLLVFCSWYPPIQDVANEQVDAGLQRAIITFASARTINGLISVVQGTEISIQPLGVGATLTLGQILDPINDLVESFSSLMLFASVAFGIQKMLLAVGGHVAVSTGVTLVSIAWIVALFSGRPRPWLNRLVLILFMIRFALPIATIGTDFAFRHIMSDDYAASQQAMLSTTRQIEVLTPRPSEGDATLSAPTDPSAAKELGLFDRMKKGVESIREGVGSRIPTIDVDAIKQAADALPERIIKLIVIFLMQTIALPLLLIWAIYMTAMGGAFGWRGRPGPAPLP